MAVTLQNQYEKWLIKKIAMPKGVDVPLIAAYLKLHRDQRDKALSRANRVCGTHYKRRRFREWEMGRRKLNVNIKKHMQRAVMVSRFGKQGYELLKLLDI